MPLRFHEHTEGLFGSTVKLQVVFSWENYHGEGNIYSFLCEYSTLDPNGHNNNKVYLGVGFFPCLRAASSFCLNPSCFKCFRWTWCCKHSIIRGLDLGHYSVTVKFAIFSSRQYYCTYNDLEKNHNTESSQLIFSGCSCDWGVVSCLSRKTEL